MHSDKTKKQCSYWINVSVQDIGMWADRTFPKSDANSIRNHMMEEIKELSDEIDGLILDAEDAFMSSFHDRLDNSIPEEMADVMLLMFHLAHKLEINLGEAVLKKFEKNQARTWDTEPNEQGYFKHKEPEEA